MIKLFSPYVHENAILNVVNTLRSGYIAQGSIERQLEIQLQEKLQNNNIVLTNSCTSALHLAYELIKSGYEFDETTTVLATPITCAASNMPILQAGFRIRWVDVECDTLNANLADIRNKWSDKTRIVAITAWGGYPPNMWQLRELRQDYHNRFGKPLEVILDLAHGFGSTFARIPTCSIDNEIFTCYSLQAIKSLTAGDGGILITPNWAYKSACNRRWFGIDRKTSPEGFRHCQDIKEVGYKYNMNDINASIAISNLFYIDEIIGKQKKNSLYLRENIKNRRIRHAAGPDSVNGSSCWLHTVFVDDAKKFISFLKDNGIEGNPVHTNNAAFTVFSEFRKDAEIPNAIKLEHQRCCIPCGWHLSVDELIKIIKVCNAYGGT
jgi:dTDP-4-amino-4,6-dideoxy-D-glucose/dTDP-4-amino-2,4-dideoxy-beta-L-xylose transaminase